MFSCVRSHGSPKAPKGPRKLPRRAKGLLAGRADTPFMDPGDLVQHQGCLRHIGPLGTRWSGLAQAPAKLTVTLLPWIGTWGTAEGSSRSVFW